MKKHKIIAAVSLVLSLLLLQACGANAEAEDTSMSENVVEINLDNVVYSSESEASQTASADTKNTDDIASQSADGEDTDSQFDEEDESSEDKDEDEIDEESQGEENKLKQKKYLNDPVDLSWFDDCVIMGDSITVAFSTCNDIMGLLGDAEFVCSGSLSWYNCQWDLYAPYEVHPVYYGEKILLEDAAAVTNSSKAIIGLGVNDLNTSGIDPTIENIGLFLEKFRAKSPDVTIYLESITPMVSTAEKGNLTNESIMEYNEKLKKFAAENDCKFLNTWSVFADENNSLPRYICEDPDTLGIHMSMEGYQMWADYILHNV